MLIAETEYKHQVETDIRPFHDVLLGLFFITIGMKLDWRAADRPVAAGAAADDAAGARSSSCSSRCWRALFGAAPGVALRTGLYLAQAGEFGFVLLAPGDASSSCCRRTLQSPVLASMVLSMLATPLHRSCTATAS